LGWIGIALVPAAQFHLSDALLTTTGKFSRRRRVLVIFGYVTGIFFAVLALWTDLVVAEPVPGAIPRLTTGPLFPGFIVYFWLVAGGSVYNVWRARQRCLTRTTRRRMTMTLFTILAAPLGVFPYLLLSNDPTQDVPLLLWPLLIIGNLVVSVLFALLTLQLVYFGSVSPDRVARVRLYKYMARVPLAATIVLLVFVLVERSGSILGLDKNVAIGFAVVATVMLVEWFIHAFKKPLERVFQLDDDPDVRRIQMLSERLLTTSELRQFLESILAATCEVVRTPTAFVAAFTPAGPRLEAVVGPLTAIDDILPETDWAALASPARSGNGSDAGDELHTVDDFIIWQGYWIQPLHNGYQDLLGIMGIRARSAAPDLTVEELRLLSRLKSQAAAALEDRLLQQEVFAAVEGLLPEITALQERRRAATFGALPVLTAEPEMSSTTPALDPEFSSMVRDALTHYWGGPKLTESPLLRLEVVRREMEESDNNAVSALRSVLMRAIEQQRPEGQRNLTTGEWILYNILDLKFIQGRRVRDVARRLAMSESDLYRKQRVAIENVARAVAEMERAALEVEDAPPDAHQPYVASPSPVEPVHV
jgi:GAF domain-containing protein